MGAKGRQLLRLLWLLLLPGGGALAGSWARRRRVGGGSAVTLLLVVAALAPRAPAPAPALELLVGQLSQLVAVLLLNDQPFGEEVQYPLVLRLGLL